MKLNNRILLAACMLLPLAGGCGSHFAGEWVQESVVHDDGTLEPVSGERRTAIQFIPPSTVRIGMYTDASGMVEPVTVATSDYQTIQDRSVAQFGAYTARVVNGQLVAYLGGEEREHYRRLHGKSVFPPLVELPQFVRAQAPADVSTPADANDIAPAVAEEVVAAAK